MMMVLKNIDAIRLIRIIPNPSSKLLGFWQAMRVGLILIMLSTTMAAHQLLAAEDDATKNAEPEPQKETKWYDKLEFEGDLRLRYEGFNWAGHFDNGRRDRIRFRLRFGVRSQLLDSLAVGLQLRSGNPDNPISDNQSFDNSFNKNKISIAQVYADWRPIKPFSLVVGKFEPTKLWTVSDMQYDDDIVTEGAMEMFGWRTGGLIKELDLNFYQFILDESGDSVDSYMFGGQVVPALTLGKTNDLAVGAGFEAISNPRNVARLYLNEDLVIDSSYVTNLIDPETGKMISDFRIGNLFLEWKNTAFANWPIKVNVFLYKNFGAGSEMGAILPVGSSDEILAFGRGTDNDTAWFGRIQVGDYKKPGQTAIRFSRYDAKPDAIFFAYGQSDTRRSSNVNGYRTDFRIGMPKNSYFNLTWYRTRWTLGDDSTMNRWQIDFIFAF
jgi:hypothetical protein